MLFSGFIIMAILLWWLFFSGRNKPNHHISPAMTGAKANKTDLLEQFLDMFHGGWALVSAKVPKNKWPVFGALLFVFIRNENYFSKRYKLTISEVMEHTKTDFEKSGLIELAKAAASKDLLKFDGNSVQLKDSPSLDELLRELFY